MLIDCLYCVPLTNKSTEICTIDSMAWTEEMFGWNSQALISLWLSCLLLSTIGLAMLYVTFQDPNKSGNFKPSPSLRPLSEQELVFLRKPKWTHFRARLKKLSFKQISRKRIHPERQMDSTVESESKPRDNRNSWSIYYWEQKVIIITKKRTQWICIKLNECCNSGIVIWNVLTVSWWIEHLWIFTLIPEYRMTVISSTISIN